MDGRKGERDIREETWIKKAKRGDEHAYRILVETYRDHVYRTVYSVLRNASDAEEAAQEVFVRAYYRLSQYEHQGFKTWLTRLAVRYAIDFKRKLDARKEESLDDVDERAEEQTVEETVLRNEVIETLYRRLGEVPQNYRDVVIAFYIEGKSYRDIAEEQNITVKSVETKLYRARKWLQTHWKEDDFR